MNTVIADDLEREVRRRRTFAIISHPDAGKTTLTEKLLLYGGAIHEAGVVRTRQHQRQVTSDWMALERERGISITTAALQFDVQGIRLNLLDTPGHQDFSEDTYRTLMAVDSAVMVVDAAKGIETQTKKLFQVCRLRNIPILTFVNKMDAPARDPFDLLDEIETVLGIDAVPMNWPVGLAPNFRGLYDLAADQVLLFSRTEHGQRQAPVQVANLHDPNLARLLGDEEHRQLVGACELLEGAGTPFNPQQFLAGTLTPVYFGSALNNFGVELFLEALLDLAPAPAPRSSAGGLVSPLAPHFSGFVFKIQGNMDPRHRDQVAFVRICSGRFERGMAVHHPRTDKVIRLARPHRLFGGEREVLDEAFPGDVVGISSKGTFAVGDCLYEGPPVAFEPIPRFAPEHFAYLRVDDVTKYKAFHTGLSQLEAEGAVQVFVDPNAGRRQPLVGAVGPLQFDVVLTRLKDEYHVEARLDPVPYSLCRWIHGDPHDVARIDWPLSGCRTAQDQEGRPVALFQSEWHLAYCAEHNPAVQFTHWA